MNTFPRTALPTEGGIQKEFADALALLGSVRSRLADLLDEASKGEIGAFKDLPALHAKLEESLRRAFETEKKYNEWIAKNAGGPAAGELDLTDIRDQIGCRLARLRTCCDTE